PLVSSSLAHTGCLMLKIRTPRSNSNSQRCEFPGRGSYWNQSPIESPLTSCRGRPREELPVTPSGVSPGRSLGSLVREPPEPPDESPGFFLTPAPPCPTRTEGSSSKPSGLPAEGST